MTDGDHDATAASLFYDLAKDDVIRLAFALADELRGKASPASPDARASCAPRRCSTTSASPRRTGATGSRRTAVRDVGDAALVGRAVAALAADPDACGWQGRALATGRLAREYGFTDVDGGRPDWGAHFAANVPPSA